MNTIVAWSLKRDPSRKRWVLEPKKTRKKIKKKIKKPRH